MMQIIRKIVYKSPLLSSAAEFVQFRILAQFKTFSGSEDYWKNRYERGGTSGGGSYGELAQFKAEVINKFVKDNGVSTVIEYGCGDGNQLKFATYPSYVGFDVSSAAIQRCENAYSSDDSKKFALVEDYCGEKAVLTLSLDVIYHLTEDAVFDEYMNRLFESSEEFVIIYSSNTDEQKKYQAAHVRYRKFTDWIDHLKEWVLIQHIPNRHPDSAAYKDGFPADFFIYQRKAK